jgi:D-alanine-D-alanine ligase
MAVVAVMMGGRSGEHEVSLWSGIEVVRAIDLSSHRVHPVVLTRENRWKVWETPVEDASTFDPGAAEIPDLGPGEALATLVRLSVEVAFLALHGPYGEDGRIQGFLEMAGIPYTGSGVTASALCMDKILTKRVMEHGGFDTPRWELASARTLLGDRGALDSLAARLGFPIVLKTPCLGSSVGMAICGGAAEVEAALRDLAPIEDRVLCEEHITGRELTCGILDGREGPEALPPTEIVPVASAYFDYVAKYTPGASEEITPARISPEETRRIQDLALRLHSLMGCSGMSRSDFIQRNGTFYALEVNTIPGMTAQSLLPQAARRAGLSFGEVIDRLLGSALSKRG